MGWLASIAVGLCTGVIGFIIALFATAGATELLRVSSREGAAGYFAFAVAILVFFAGIVLGIVCARHVASFGKALGTATAIVAGVAVVGLSLSWLVSDPAPRIDGSRLDLAIELRCPPGFTLPELSDPSDAYATIVLLPGGNTRRWSRMEMTRSRMEDGRLVVPTLLPLDTSAASKLLAIRLGKHPGLHFAFDFKRRPTEKDMQWSRWIQAAWPAGSPQPAQESSFHVRYRVQKEPPPPKVLTRAEEEALELAKLHAEFQALPADAPIEQWLRFTRYGNPQELQRGAASAIASRPAFEADMSQALRSEDPELANLALRSVEHFSPTPIVLAAHVEAVGQEIVRSLQAFTAMSPEDELRQTMAATIASKFSSWIDAARALQAQENVTFVPVLQEIANLSRQNREDAAIRRDVLRVASFYLNKWAGIAPLPGDPSPR